VTAEETRQIMKPDPTCDGRLPPPPGDGGVGRIVIPGDVESWKSEWNSSNYHKFTEEFQFLHLVVCIPPSDALRRPTVRQVFEELFQAYQQRIPEQAVKQYAEEQWVDQGAIPYDCPGAAQLDLSFQTLPSTINIPTWLWTNVPYIAVFFGSVSFIFVCLWIAIFKCPPPPLAPPALFWHPLHRFKMIL